LGVRLGMWNAKTGDKIRTLDLPPTFRWPDPSTVCNNVFSPCGTTFSTTGYDLGSPQQHTLLLYEGDFQNPMQIICTDTCTDPGCHNHALFSPDGMLVALGCSGTGTTSLWSSRNGHCLAEFQDNPGIPLQFYASEIHLPSIVSVSGRHHVISQCSISLSTVSAIRAASPRYQIRGDGWLFDGPRRVCWVPPDYRAVQNLEASHGNKLALFTAKDIAVIIDFSQVSDF